MTFPKRMFGFLLCMTWLEAGRMDIQKGLNEGEEY
jgi:hypothetical protein